MCARSRATGSGVCVCACVRMCVCVCVGEIYLPFYLAGPVVLGTEAPPPLPSFPTSLPLSLVPLSTILQLGDQCSQWIAMRGEKNRRGSLGFKFFFFFFVE